MQHRNLQLLALRGESIGEINANSSPEEVFQNSTLRPILKAQNDLFIAVFINYAIKQKNVFFELTPGKKTSYIDNAIQRDIKFRTSLIGMVTGLFTIAEYNEYAENSSNLNKRIITLLAERFKSQVVLLTLKI
ncbi:glyoxalase [Flavobacterium sp.]